MIRKFIFTFIFALLLQANMAFAGTTGREDFSGSSNKSTAKECVEGVSRAMFIFSYNDESKVNPILKDRMYRIHTAGYKNDDKCIIARKYLIPKIEQNVNFQKDQIVIPDETIRHISDNLTDKEIKSDNVIVIEEGQPMIFGKEKDKGLILDGAKFKVVSIGDDYSIDDILIHNPEDRNLGLMLSEMTYDENLPVPIGIFYKEIKPTYDEMMSEQINKARKNKMDLQSIIKGTNSWIVK